VEAEFRSGIQFQSVSSTLIDAGSVFMAYVASFFFFLDGCGEQFLRPLANFAFLFPWPKP
jgi:hypothetical protein